jgi:hypothetical protein
VSLRRRQPLAEPLALAARQLKQCEAHVALLDRVRPLNLAHERLRLREAVLAGQRPQPELAYAAAPDLSPVQRALDALLEAPAADLEGALLAERARELALEAQLAARVGLPGFRHWAGQRFPLPAAHAELRPLALAWAELPRAVAAVAPALHFSDDKNDPDSLWSLLSRRLEAKRLSVRLEVTPGLASLAAVADGVVRLRGGARLSRDVAQRIALHEVEGHVVPRSAGRALAGIFAAGSAGASEDEEGRALLLEERAGLMDVERRAELGLRYLAAESVRQGAEFWETFQLLLERGADSELAVDLCCRVQRGGGLGRELVYLSGYVRVAGSFSSRPELEGVLAGGRVSVAAAGSLLDAALIELDDDRDVI